MTDIESFPLEVAQKLKTYVYRLIDRASMSPVNQPPRDRLLFVHKHPSN
jgi:hypothetical protein